MIQLEQLAYAVIEATDPIAWRTFAEAVVGTAAAEAPDGGLYLKIDDERDFRITVERGTRNRFAACGWQLADEAAFRRAEAALHAAGVAVMRGDAALCARRRVQAVLCLEDPAGNRHELFWGPQSCFARFVSPAGVPGFVTGALGLGHVVLPAPQFDRTWEFLQRRLGLGLADLYRHPDPAAPKGARRIHFAHCGNGRHHSLALFEGEVPSGCVHLMLELPSMDEVGRAHDRVLRHGVRLMATLGRHVNDGVTSFYLATPGGFALELGCGGRVLDWARHSVFESSAVSLWGHDFSVGFR